MEVHQLRYFCAIIRTGTFTRAAESEHVAQPSLSQQIIKLEDELGVKLFDRLPRKARLTSFGLAFFPRAQAILRPIQDARAEILAMAALPSLETRMSKEETIELNQTCLADRSSK